MKKIILAIIVIAVVVGGLYYTRQEGVYTVDSSDYLAPGVFVSSTTEVLNEEEEAGLLLMREEEKLARDVYTALADMWGARVFSHIARSEQTHMDAVLDLLNAYNVPDPVAVDEPGKFVNPELQALYESLVDRGSSSIAEAYQVGATIEDLDIADLDRLLAQTNNADIAVTYKNLQKGSRNHLRAFVKNIRDEYIPQYISEEQYQLIISSPQERGVVRE